MNLLPIIRRKRRPLIPPEDPRVEVQPAVAEVSPKTEQEISDDPVSKKNSSAADVVDY